MIVSVKPACVPTQSWCMGALRQIKHYLDMNHAISIIKITRQSQRAATPTSVSRTPSSRRF
eukprot:2214102-Pyramimonas_sp.AAC.1